MATINTLKLDPPLRGRIYDSIAETIGNTPLVRIPRLSREEGLEADIVAQARILQSDRRA